MSRVDVRRFARSLMALAALAATGCTSFVVFGEKHFQGASTDVIRVATERGIKDASPRPSLRPGAPAAQGLVRLEIPLEIRTGADSLVLPGCALQPFKIAAISGPEFPVTGVQGDPDLRLEFSPGDSVTPPQTRRIVTATLIIGASDPATESLGIRIDETPAALAPPFVCAPLEDTDPDFVQHFGLRRMEVETGGVGIAAGAVLLFSILLVGR